MRRLATLLGAVAIAAAVPAAAGAAPPSHAAAVRALAKAQQLSRGKGVKTGRELTPALNKLFASLPSLSRDDRLAAKGILARPDDLQDDPSGTHKWSQTAVVATPVCGAHFCIHYVTTTADAPDLTDGPDAGTTPDYVDEMLRVFENEVYPCENGSAANACAAGTSPGLGWREPESDGTAGGNCTPPGPSCTDVYIEDLFPDRIFGYVALDPGQAQDPSGPPTPKHAYMVMDKDFSRFGDGSAAANTANMDVTAAHEYNHVLQNAYDFAEDTWMFEATAVYMEDKVYPAINDYLDYVKSWVANTAQPLTAFPDTNLKAYGSAVWNHWLDGRHGANVVRGAWEQSVAAGDFAPNAYSAAITGAGGAGFADEFDRFAAAVTEWNVQGSGFPDHSPDVPRSGELPAGTQTVPFSVAHTTFALFDVPIPAGASTIRLVGSLPTGTSGAIALVGRTGVDPNGGAVTSNLTPMPDGGTAAVSIDNPSQFGRITAVVVNADPSRSGFDPQAQDWIFTKDAPGVTLAVVAPGAPIVSTGPPSLVTDHAGTISGDVDPHLLDTTWSFEYGLTTAYGSATAPQPIAGSSVNAARVTAPLASLKANTTYHYRLVATNSAGTTRGADMVMTTARDVTKPIVSFVVKRQKLRTVRTRGFFYLGRCSERCLGSAQLTVTRALARKLGTSTVLGKGRIALDPKTQSVTLRIGATKRAKKKLAKVRKGFTATVKIRVADESGNSVSLSRRVKLSR